MPNLDEEHLYIANAVAGTGDKLAARWALITMTADVSKTEAEARAISEQAVRDLTDNQKDRAA